MKIDIIPKEVLGEVRNRFPINYYLMTKTNPTPTKLTKSSFYRTDNFICTEFYKPISKLIKYETNNTEKSEI